MTGSTGGKSKSTSSEVGVIQAIATRAADGDAMREVPSCRLVAGAFLEGERRGSPKRGVTMLSQESWRDVCHDLGTDLPWHTRRANLLVSGLDLADLIGRTIEIGRADEDGESDKTGETDDTGHSVDTAGSEAIGPARLEILAETRPCQLMDDLHQGLRKTLEPACRGGVYGRIIQGGEVRVGDTIRVVSAT